MVALHATDPASVHLAAAARLRDPTVAQVEAALYEERTLVRLLGMRRTMFVIQRHHVPVVDAACGQILAERERRKLVQLVQGAGDDAPCGNVTEWLAGVEAATLAALHARGQASGRELSQDVPELRTTFVYAAGKKWGGQQTITTRMLSVLSLEGKIVRGRPVGTWASGQYRWAAMDEWLGSLEAAHPLSADEARTQLIRAWLGGFGPATVADIKWWTGLTLGQVRKALTAIEPVEVELEGTTGVLLAEDQEPVDPPDQPWIALLPALDPTAMGWTERDWYLSREAREQLFDRSGNVGPTIWCDGRIVGGWGQRKGGPHDGEVVYRLFEDIGRELTAEVESSATRLGVWHGDVRVTPRFRTPLERELTT